MRTVDLKGVTVGAADLAEAVETFRKNFGFSVTRRTEERVALGIGAAEIEFTALAEDGLQEIVLRVDSLETAEDELRSRGHGVMRETINGRPALLVGREAANGVRLVLTE